MRGSAPSTLWGGMTEDEIDRELEQMLETARQLGFNLDPVMARKKITYLHSQAHEHGVSIDDIMRRNLLRELFGGGARP